MSTTIYAATYSNVPVYEFTVEGKHVMRRRSDDWINATHILKLADYDKPARTRILEREVQKGVHEKVQGGYGKYQGTWIPLSDGRDLASKNGVLEKLLPIFDYRPGDRSPPPAPKHATAASTKPRGPRGGGAGGAPVPPRKQPAIYHQRLPDYPQIDPTIHDPTPDRETLDRDSPFDEYDATQYPSSRKRRRIQDPMSQADREHQLWADDLLDYFMLQEDPLDSAPAAPVPPVGANLNLPIDERGHTALHWAAAMGDVEVVKDLIRRGASIDAQSKNGETPLMRSVIFTNSFDRRNMEKLAALLIRTVNMQEWLGSTVFHHIAAITQSRKKYECARYYMDCILNKMAEVLSPDQIERVLNEPDQNGDTAVTIAARNGARKCIRSLIGRNAAVDIPNSSGETADPLIVQLNHRRQERNAHHQLHSHNRQLSSSPFQADPDPSGLGGAIPFDPFIPQASLNASTSASASVANGTTSDVYKSDAALTLTSQIMPVLFTKAQTLASTIDAEIAEKDAELAEAERVAAMRRAEIEQLKRQAEELRAKELEQMAAGGESDEQLLQELEALERECESLTDAEQTRALNDRLRDELRKTEAGVDGDKDDNDTTISPEAETVLREKLSLARELATLQRRRRELVKSIVRHLAVAGLGERQEEYKRLVTGALGVREQDVEGMLPEIVAELEDWRGLEGVGV